ncbi:MAG TPA: M56 family metallopeptidase [Verrucomicrobiota bacterium]|nr:M56 family metallopeptidase [Verrucomicrobiota bacterium]
MSIELICHRLLSALANGGYQGVLLTLLVGLGLKLLPRTNAATRHAVWFVALLLVAALPAVHLAFLNSVGTSAVQPPILTPFDSDAVPASYRNPGVPTASSTLQTATTTSLATAPLTSDDGWDLFAAPALELAWRSPDVSSPAIPNLSHSEWSEPTAVDPTGETIPSGHESVRLDGNSGTVYESQGESRLADPIERLGLVIPEGGRLALARRTAILLVVVWLGVALVRLGRLVQQWLHLRSLKRSGTPAPDDWQAVFEKLGAEMGLTRKTRLIVGPAGSAPLVAGLRQPAVVLPAGMFDQASGPELGQVLRHELGHVLRRDDWANLIQQVIKAVLFFHPAVWWLSGRLTLEREIACDDHVLVATRSPRAYALLLTEFAGRRRCRGIAAAPAAWNHKTQLKERIAMILDSKRNASTRLARTSAGVLLTASALFTGWVLLAGPRLALASDDPTPTPTPETTIATDEQQVIVSTESQEPDALPVASATGTTVSIRTDAPVPPVLPAVATSVTIASAPRVKASPRIEVPAPAIAPLPALAPVPPTPAHPAFSHPPRGPLAFNSNDDDDAPKKTSSARSKSKDSDDSSLERRMDRLEKMVKELVAKWDTKRTETMNEFALRLKSDLNSEKFAGLTDEIKKATEQAGLSQGEISRIKEQAERDAKHAVREAQRATKEIQRAASEARASARQTADASQDPKREHEIEVQKKALESTRKSLEQQIQSIERQLEQLEEAQEELQERAEKLRDEKDSKDDSGREKPRAKEASSEPKKKATF